MKKLLVLGFLSSAFLATDAFADIAVDPCTGMSAGDACIVDAGGTEGMCVDVEGSLECKAAATNNAPNNATNNSTTGSTNAGTNNTNNATNNLTNNGTAPRPGQDPNENPDPDKTEEESDESKDDGGCTTASGNGLVSIVIGLAFVALGRVRR